MLLMLLPVYLQLNTMGDPIELVHHLDVLSEIYKIISLNPIKYISFKESKYICSYESKYICSQIQMYLFSSIKIFVPSVATSCGS